MSRGESREHVALVFSQVHKEREDVSIDVGTRKRRLIVGGRGSRDRHGGRSRAVLQRSRGIGGVHRPTLVPADIPDPHAHLTTATKLVPARTQGRRQ